MNFFYIETLYKIKILNWQDKGTDKIRENREPPQIYMYSLIPKYLEHLDSNTAAHLFLQ